MPFEIVRNDITKMSVDAIVNTANPKPVVGSGTDTAVHKKAGPELLKARRCIGRIEPGHAAITPAYNLDAKYVIHTVGPIWIDGAHKEEMLLQSCYENALYLAAENNCQSVAFPLISAGNYGFPKDRALEIAISAFSAFLLEHDMEIYLVVYDYKTYKLSEKLFQNVASYIDENYVDESALDFCEIEEERKIFPLRATEVCESLTIDESVLCAPAVAKVTTLEEILNHTDTGFTETLLKLIEKTGKKDSEIYKKANVSKQHFSKIRNNPHYQPTKATAIAFALALELDVEQTNDLIGRAGYTLTKSSKFDLIIQFFIQQKKYNIVEINIALYEFDQNLLGA